MSQRSMHISEADGEMDLQELNHDLARRYRTVGEKVGTIWRNFTPKQREQAVRRSVSDGKVPKHSGDYSLGPMCELVPEYNLRDMTSDPEHYLNIFKFRATTPLDIQLYCGANGMPGDYDLVEKSDSRAMPRSEGQVTCFLQGRDYGKSFLPPKDPNRGPLCPNLPAEYAKLVVLPREIGQIILLRQELLFPLLNHIVEEILALGSETRSGKAPEQVASEALITAVSNLNVQPKPLKSSLPEVRAQAKESKAALEDSLLVLRTEPIVLRRTIQYLNCSRSELVPDEQGRVVPAISDRYFSGAFFDSVTTAVKAIAIWDYILRLLELLDDARDKVKRSLILQELVNTCHLEFRRTQESFKRKIAMFTARKNFKRVTNGTSGRWKIAMKGQPADYTVLDPHLHYILRLCQVDTSPTSAVQWIQKLDDHHARHPQDRMKLSDAEMTSLGDLAIIVSFMHMTSTTVSMAPLSRKSGLLFTTRSVKLEVELNNLKADADFGDYLIPIDNILEPEVATQALAALDDFIVQETGARLGSLYEDMVQDSLQDLEKMYVEAKARLEEADKKTTYVPLPKESPPSADARLATRKAKEKSRPTGPSANTITATLETPHITTTEPTQQFKSEARGSVPWTAFEAAMADLEFSVTPKGGSVYNFNPPHSMETRPITLHKPHVSEIEGYRLLILKRRLERAYGWSAETFVVT